MSDWKQPTMLLYAFFSHPGGVISQDYESCVLYLYIPFSLLLFISSNYVFHPINLSLNIYLHPARCFAGRLVCSLVAKQPAVSSILIYLKDFEHVAHMISCGLGEWRDNCYKYVIKIKSHVLHIWIDIVGW